MTPRPLWRWWLFCFAAWAWGRFGQQWALDLLGWCVLPEWLGCDGTPAEVADAPF